MAEAYWNGGFMRIQQEGLRLRKRLIEYCRVGLIAWARTQTLAARVGRYANLTISYDGATQLLRNHHRKSA
jgi:hypothetical protein